MEYRGYDSAGVATITPMGDIDAVKAAGRIDRLQEMLARSASRPDRDRSYAMATTGQPTT